MDSHLDPHLDSLAGSFARNSMLRILLALVLALLGAALVAAGGMTLYFSDPFKTTLVLMGAGAVLLGAAAWLFRRR